MLKPLLCVLQSFDRSLDVSGIHFEANSKAVIPQRSFNRCAGAQKRVKHYIART